MIGRQFGRSSPHPPKCTVTDPSGLGVRGDVVDAVGVAVVGLEVAVGVVDRDRPEPVDGYVAHGELVLPGREARVDVEVERFLLGQPAPSDGVPIRCRIGSTASLRPKVWSKALRPRARVNSGVAGRVEAGRVVVGHGERAGRSASASSGPGGWWTAARSAGSLGSTRIRTETST